MALNEDQESDVRKAVENLLAALKCESSAYAADHIRTARNQLLRAIPITPARQTAEQTEVGPHPECSVRTGDALTGLCACGHLVAAHRHRQGDRSIAGSVECVLCRALTWPPR